MKNRRDIAHIPGEPVRDRKPVDEIRFIDPCCGSGNFFQAAFDLFFEMYKEEGYKDKDIPEKILANNLYGIDLDDRAVQIAHLGLFIKSLEKNPDFSMSITNIVSTDFHLPEFKEVKDIFTGSGNIPRSLNEIKDIWNYIKQAEKFGSLIDLKNKLQSNRPEVQRPIIQEEHEYETQKELLNLIKTAFYKCENGNSLRSFIKKKAEQGLSFVEIISQKYDIAASNPPYTSSNDYGDDLKEFIEANYKKEEYSFYPNLYACFLKRNTDLINEDGKVGMIHPLTFMFIKTFEDVRKYILSKYSINVFVEFGLGDTFGSIMADPAIYVIEKSNTNEPLFISLNQYTRTPEEKFKRNYMEKALKDFIEGQQNKHNYILNQEKLKIIEGWPFVYWISDSFRDKFKGKNLSEVVDVCSGVATANNLRFLRYWWEVDKTKISNDYRQDKKRWVKYSKGGPFERWHGNLWLLIDWDNNGEKLRNYKSVLRNEEYYFREGITYSATSTKGVSYRLLPKNCIYDVKGASIFTKDYKNIYYLVAILNSKFSSYVVWCLNSTVETQVSDNKRIPFVIPKSGDENIISSLSENCVSIKQKLCEYSIIESEYLCSPVNRTDVKKNNLQEKLRSYLDFENSLKTTVLICEAIINEKIFEVYELTDEDEKMILEKEGFSTGSFHIIINEEITLDKLEGIISSPEHTKKIIKNFIEKLEIQQVGTDEWKALTHKVEDLYEKSESIENISLEFKVNPLTVTYILKDSSVIPKNKSRRIIQEFVLDQVRNILIDDDDGIVPLHLMSGENTVFERLIEKLHESGFYQKDIYFLEILLNKKLDKYLESNFFADECDILNKFMYVPKTPFIWHLSGGKTGGIDLFLIIYKWSRDKLLKVKSVYAQKRKTGLENRLAQLADGESIKVDEEKEAILGQLIEIDEFCKKIDKILSEGYEPILDDGVGRNIAPLQKEGILKIDVLTQKELKNFLNADW